MAMMSNVADAGRKYIAQKEQRPLIGFIRMNARQTRRQRAMRSEEQAELDGFKKGLDMQIDVHFIGYLVVAILSFLIGLALGLIA